MTPIRTLDELVASLRASPIEMCMPGECPCRQIITGNRPVTPFGRNSQPGTTSPGSAVN